MRRGFTLVEVAVVNISLAGLIGLLVPALGEARRVARNAVSMANLNALNQIHKNYAADNTGSFYNPWNENWPANGGGGQSWDVRGADGASWSFLGSNFKWTTECWGLYWYSTASKNIIADPGAYASAVQFSPTDDRMIQSFRAIDFLGSGRQYIWPGSYIMSPTLWLKPERYPTVTGSQPADRVDYSTNPLSLRRNRFSDATYPSQKVVLFERFDFKQDTRFVTNIINGRYYGTFRGSPNWNNPTAKPNVALVDGSVRYVDMKVLADATSLDGRAVNLTRANELTPCGLFRPSRGDIWADSSDNGNLSLEWGDLASGSEYGGTYRNFFWATRRGIQGRDFD